MTLVTIKLTIGLPKSSPKRPWEKWVVHYSMFGSNFAYTGPRARLALKIDLSKPANNSLQDIEREWEEHQRYAPIAGPPWEHVYPEPELSWFQLIRAPWARKEHVKLEVTNENLNAVVSVPNGMTHGVRLIVDGRDPLLPLAPNVNADIFVGIKQAASTGAISGVVAGKHDGFPSFFLTVSDTDVYSWNVIEKKGSPALLHAPMDQIIPDQAFNI